MRIDRLAQFRQLYARADPGWRSFYASQIASLAESQPEAVPQRPRIEPQWRAKNERAWARLFDALGVTWRYEAIEPEISRAIQYIPDFWLPDLDTFVEIKGDAPTAGECSAAWDLLAATGCAVYILTGWPHRKSFEVYIFSGAGSAVTRRADWCDLALGQLFDCGFNEIWAGFDAVKKGYRKNGGL